MLKRKKLYIVGAGAFSREILSWMDFESGTWVQFEFAGFLSDDFSTLENYPQYSPGIVSSTKSFQPGVDDRFVMGIGDPKNKIAIANELEARGAQFVKFIHPTVILGRHVELGRGVVICPNVIISCHAKICDFVSINLCSTVGHDVEVGCGCTLSSHVDLTGFSKAGSCAFFGSHASVLPGVKIGDGAKVGAGSVVIRSIPAGVTCIGVPAKQVFP